MKSHVSIAELQSYLGNEKNSSRPSLVVDLGNRNFLKVILIFQFAVFGLVLFDHLIVEVPILRQIICFIYLTFVPGILILRVLKLRGLSITETILYSIGLSLSLLMFIGFLINFLYPFLGISRPISEFSLLITISFVVFSLCFLSFLREKNLSFTIDTKIVASPPTLFLLLFPFLAIFGTFYSNNVLLIQLAIISIIPIFVALDKFPKNAHTLALWVISLSLLFQNSLPSMYPRYTDNTFEYSVAKQVLENGFWDPSAHGNLNAMLSIVMLLPIFVEICRLNLTWVFKLIVPLFYSFIPVGLYYVFKKQTNEKIAFLSCFFFISFYEFYTWAGLTVKTVTAGLFLTLLLLLITDEKIDKLNKSVLSLIFAFSLAVSHYGTSYIFMFCIVAVLSMMPLLRKISKDYEDRVRTITPKFVTLYILFAVTWYLYSSGGSPFNTMVRLGNHIINSILKAYFIPEESHVSIVLFEQFSKSLQIVKNLSIVSVFFIIIGILSLFRKRDFEFNNEYKALSIAFVFVGASVFIGHMSGAATPDRVFHLIAFCLAPFCIIGGIKFFRGLMKMSKFSGSKIKDKKAIVAVSLFLSIYLLSNTGFLSEVVLKDFPGAPIYISAERIEKSGTVQEKEYLHRTYIMTCDVSGGKWLSINRDATMKIYSDERSARILTHRVYGVEIYGDVETLRLENLRAEYSYIYLTKLNSKDGIFIVSNYPRLKFFNLSEVSSLLSEKNKIYDNGCSEVYG